jgi:uncharacterized protein YjiS (DUF1127 family)
LFNAFGPEIGSRRVRFCGEGFCTEKVRQELPMAALCSSQSIERPRREPAAVRFVFAIALNAMRKFARVLKNRRRARMLAGMDDRMLADIGLNRSDLRDAYAQPLWRDPTDVLADRAQAKRSSRRNGVGDGRIPAPGLVPDEGFRVPRTDRQARHTI